MENKHDLLPHLKNSPTFTLNKAHISSMQNTRMAKEKESEKCLRKSLEISPFLNNKIKLFLKEDKKKKKTDSSEFRGCLNPYMISLLREDLKRRGFL